jgi:hypothetical protein
MAEERKGFLTPEQEKKLDELLKFNNKFAEAVDGLAIQLLDNQVLERLKGKLNDLHPDAVEIAYQVIDEIFTVIDKVSEK